MAWGVAAGLWWLFIIREAPKEVSSSTPASDITERMSSSIAEEVNTQSAGTIHVLAVITLVCWPILWFAATVDSSRVLFFAGCVALSQGVFLWGFGNIVESLAHIRHNTTKA